MISNWSPAQKFMALLAAIGGIAFLVVVVKFWGAAYKAHQEIERIVPQIARLKGLAGAEEQLEAAVQNSESVLLQLVYPASSDSSALGNNMQQQMREIFREAGVDVSGSQVMPASEEGVLQRVRVKLNASTDMLSLVYLLELLDAARPLVVIDSIDLKPERRRNSSGQQLDTSFVLSSFALPQS
ncbi:type II secretion system protein GspM [Gilvimarinus chinensis]|uniref:type II secretion system protein GspM n=1 Tax=Gilvimarinus chinensis TaxID=396005 RepID=UPI0005916A05|nr:type II secretion system protein GspM [Gilvimarinus chinensis]